MFPTAKEIIKLIRSLVRDEDQAMLTDAELTRAFQEVHGLKLTGQVDRPTAREALRPRFCAVKDILFATASRSRWDHTNWNGSGWVNGTPSNMELKYHIAAPLTGLSRTQTDEAFAEALGYWTKECAIIWTPVLDPARANLLCNVGKIDGPSGTLAWCELPQGPDTPNTQLDSLYDQGEPWVDSQTPGPSQIDAVRVICHEMGHGIGLPHGPEGNLLAPYYDRVIRKPQDWDIAEARVRYGPPVPPDAGPPVPPGNDSDQLIISAADLSGKKWGGPIYSLET